MNLYKTFGKNQVLKGINFSAEGGRALGLLGRNGAGKTTTIRILMGVFPADSGSVLLNGVPFIPRPGQVGYLPEERGLYPKKTVLEQLIYIAMLRGMNKSDAKASAVRLLAKLEMSRYTGQKLNTLSKGNQQKIQLIATLITQPEMIILDEPFSGLDPVNAMLLREQVMEFIDKGGIVLFSSHQMGYVEEFCSDIAILNNGVIVRAGDIGEIKRSFGRSEMVLTGENMDQVESTARARMDALCDRFQRTENGRELILHLRSPELAKEAMAAAGQFGELLDQIRIRELSMNDIFVKYTTDEGEAEAK